MAVIRHMHSHRDQFTVIPNSVLRDSRLSFRARGILDYLLSHQDGFCTSARSMAEESPTEGRDAILTGLTELETFGYLRRPRSQGDNGRWRTTYEVYGDGDADSYPQTAEDVSAGQTESGPPGSGTAGPKKRTNEEDHSLTHSVVSPMAPAESPAVSEMSDEDDDEHEPATPGVGSVD